MKMVKVRPNTINKMRELEVLKDDLKVAGKDSPAPSGEGSSSAVAGDVMQGLYAFSQTEIYIPVPVIDVSIYCSAF
jgi:xeroderma pigmentosum group C-complementing protein